MTNRTEKELMVVCFLLWLMLFSVTFWKLSEPRLSLNDAEAHG